MKKHQTYVSLIFTIMKISFMQIVIALVLAGAVMASPVASNGQGVLDEVISISLENEKVKTVLSAIEKSVNVKFTYNPQSIPINKKISVDLRDKKLSEVLNACLTPLNVQYEVSGEYIILSKNVVTGSNLFNTSSENVTVYAVSGKITDENGSPLPGVNIIEKGTSNGTSSDADGRYSLNVLDGNATLVFTFIGYETREVPVGNQSVIDVTLQPDIRQLEEVVVVGYGTQRKSDLTGAVSVAEPEEMRKQATNDVTQMLQGRIPGVAVTTDGQPGASPIVRIRGVSSFGLGGSTDPLYVVDGFPLPGGIRDINPNDIESIQVLKDATAGAIYGNRAANGVVIITTKSGRKNQDLTVGFDAYYGHQTVPQRIPVLGREGYQLLMNEALANVGQPPKPGNDPTSPFFIDDIDTDWQDAGYKNGYIQNYNVNLSGGTSNTNYFISLDYLDNVGTLVGTGPDYKRYSLRVNSETQRGRFKVGENLYLTRSDENPLFFTTSISLPGGRPSLVNDLVQAAPTIPVYDPAREGGFGGADQNIHTSITLNVPGINTLIENSTDVNRLLANVYGELEIIRGLAFRTSLTYDKTSIQDELFVPEYDLGYFFPGPTAFYQVGSRNSGSFLIENTLRYTKQFGDHNLEVLAGQTFQDFDFREVRTFGSGLEKPYFRTLASATTVSASDNQQPAAIASLLGRVNYAFKDKYLLTVNVRRDGSSRFRNENRYEIFPSVGVAWKIHKEFTLPSFISDLKLRGGIGQLGNQEIGNFRFQPTINRAIPYQFGPDMVADRVFGAAQTILVDAGIQWESKTTRTVGIDAMLFNGNVEFTAEYYSNISDGVLLELPVPHTVGAFGSLLTTNEGKIRNSGIELSGSYRAEIGDFSLGLSPNFYTVKNEVLNLGPLENITEGGGRTVEGRSIGEHYGYVYDGIFQNANEINTVAPSDPAFDPNRHAFQSTGTAPGDIRFRDLDGNGVINEEDRTFLGKGMPTYYYGLNITGSYKNWDLTIFGSGSGGNVINSNIYRGLMSADAFGFTNRHEDMLGRWTPENPQTDIPRIAFQGGNDNNRDSNRPGWLQSGNYFRLNTISLGYSISSKLLTKIRMNSARIYATIQNVHTFTKYKGYNPDFQSSILNPGFDYGTFPRPRTTMIGVQLKF